MCRAAPEALRRPRRHGAGRGLYGPASEAWRLNREAMLLLGAGPRALLLQLAHPAVAAGVADHSDLPGPTHGAAWRGTMRSYLTIVYGIDAASPAPRSRGSTRSIGGSRGPGYCGPRPRALAVGPRDARRLDPGGLRRVARAAVGGARGRVLRRDAPGRAGVRHARGPCCRRTSTRSRRISRRCSRPDGPVRVSPVARELAGVVLHPRLGAACRRARLGAAGRVRLDAVAVDRRCCRPRCARSLACAGAPRGRRGWRGCALASSADGGLPAAVRWFPIALAAPTPASASLAENARHGRCRRRRAGRGMRSGGRQRAPNGRPAGHRPRDARRALTVHRQ